MRTTNILARVVDELCATQVRVVRHCPRSAICRLYIELRRDELSEQTLAAEEAIVQVFGAGLPVRGLCAGTRPSVIRDEDTNLTKRHSWA